MDVILSEGIQTQELTRLKLDLEMIVVILDALTLLPTDK